MCTYSCGICNTAAELAESLMIIQLYFYNFLQQMKFICRNMLSWNDDVFFSKVILLVVTKFHAKKVMWKWCRGHSVCY